MTAFFGSGSGVAAWRPAARFGSMFPQIERHEDAVRIRHVVGKGRALLEAVAPIERAGGKKVLPRARLELRRAKSLARAAAMMWRSIALPTPLRRAELAVCIDFTSPWSGRAASARRSPTAPRRPRSSRTRCRAIVVGYIQGVCAAPRRLRSCGGDVHAQQLDDARVLDVAGGDPDHACVDRSCPCVGGCIVSE